MSGKKQSTWQRIRLWGPAVVWLGLIYVSSSVSVPGSIARLVRHQDKAVHFVEFGILGVLLARALYHSGGGSRGRYWLCILATVLYGGLDEFHQSFVPVRTMDWADLTADGLGAFFLTWAYLRLKGESLFRIAAARPGSENRPEQD